MLWEALLSAVALGTTPVTAGSQDVPGDFVITLERTQCFGACPAYRVSIDAKGNVIYDGLKFVRVEGRRTDRIPPSHVAALFATAARIGFFNLRDRYLTIRRPDGTETFASDGPTTFVSMTLGGRSKRVEDYLGAPEALTQLEHDIDESARTRRWVRIDAAMVQELAREGWAPSLEERAQLLGKALQYDEVDVVTALLEIGANPNPVDARHTPPLLMVRSAAAARALIDKGAVASVRDDASRTPLGWAVHLAPEVTQLLLRAGVPVDEPTASDGRTALWQAACAGNVGVVELLLGAGAIPTRRTASMSPIDCAREGKNNAHLPGPSILQRERPFVPDFDGVIALLEQALGKRQ